MMMCARRGKRRWSPDLNCDCVPLDGSTVSSSNLSNVSVTREDDAEYVVGLEFAPRHFFPGLSTLYIRETSPQHPQLKHFDIGIQVSRQLTARFLISRPRPCKAQAAQSQNATNVRG